MAWSRAAQLGLRCWKAADAPRLRALHKRAPGWLKLGRPACAIASRIRRPLTALSDVQVGLVSANDRRRPERSMWPNETRTAPSETITHGREGILEQEGLVSAWCSMAGIHLPNCRLQFHRPPSGTFPFGEPGPRPPPFPATGSGARRWANAGALSSRPELKAREAKISASCAARARRP